MENILLNDQEAERALEMEYLKRSETSSLRKTSRMTHAGQSISHPWIYTAAESLLTMA